MSCTRRCQKLLIVPILGASLLATAGCGGGSVAVDPEGGEKLKQARINAYGKSGMQNAKGTGSGSGPDMSGQASRRRQQGAR